MGTSVAGWQWPVITKRVIVSRVESFGDCPYISDLQDRFRNLRVTRRVTVCSVVVAA